VITQIYLVRHGESEWNRTHRYTGRQDPPLSPLGQIQAERVGKRLAEEPISAIYASPLLRAIQTAQPTADEKSLTIRREEDFAEIHHGDWEGFTTDEVAKRFPNELTMWRDQPHLVVMPNGESLDDVRHRVIPTFHRLLQTHGGEPFAIFSHDAVERVILLHSLGIGFERFWEWRIENASVTLLEYRDDSYRLSLLNDISHLEGVSADYESQAL
jgi:probable phosphoglycerate mutase